MDHRTRVRKNLAAFKGVLREPIRPKVKDTHASENERQTQLARHAAELRQERIAALFAHYGINHTRLSKQAWMQLALRLADDFVPDFQLKIPSRAKVGRKTKWTPEALFELAYNVELVCARDRVSALEACRKLTRLGRPYHGHRPDSLYRIHQKSIVTQIGKKAITHGFILRKNR